MYGFSDVYAVCVAEYSMQMLDINNVNRRQRFVTAVAAADVSQVYGFCRPSMSTFQFAVVQSGWIVDTCSVLVGLQSILHAVINRCGRQLLS